MKRLLATLLALSLLVAGAVPVAMGASPGSDTANTVSSTSTAAANNSSVNVTVGQQLSTIVAQTDSEVRSDIENSAFELRYESANESERAEAIDERAEELTERAERIREAYREATAAYEAGELTKSEYAQRLASLNARAEDLLQNIRALRERAKNVSSLELRAAGFNKSQLSQADQQLDVVTGAGASALLQRYTGQSQGELELETKGGLSISVESEDGEQSRELERPRDANDNITVNQATALDAARSALGSPENGSWSLRKASVHEGDGYYEFTFGLTGANATGSAEVKVDGSSGQVFSLESEIETSEADEGDESEDAEDERETGEAERENETENESDEELALIVADGTPKPNATVTLKALSGNDTVSDATVTMNGDVVGTTGAAGTITVTLPGSGEAELTATKGEAEGELEFEFAENESAELERNLRATGSVSNGTVTVQVTYNGSGVSGAHVYAGGQQVGTTGSDGALSFETNASEELEVRIVKGAFEAELTFEVRDGSLNLTQTEVENETEESDSEDEQDSDETETEDTESDSDSDSDSTDDSDDSDDSDTDSDDEETDSDDEETETPEP